MIQNADPSNAAKSILDSIRQKKENDYEFLAAWTKERDDKIKAIKSEEASLRDELSHLGIFKGKRKKEIAEILDGIPGRIKAVEGEYMAKKQKV